MSAQPVFLTVEQVLSIHERVVKEFGGNPAVLDRGLLESAVAMPAARYGGRFLHTGIPAMAAAYLFHVCRNHPFADGNKRTALAAAEVFMLLNGQEMVATNRDLVKLTLGVAEGAVPKAEVTSFFIQHAASERK